MGRERPRRHDDFAQGGFSLLTPQRFVRLEVKAKYYWWGNVFFKIGDDRTSPEFNFEFCSWRYAVMTHCQLTKALSELWVDWSVWSWCYLMLLDWCFVVRWRASVQQITSGKERSMWGIFFVALPDFRLIACFTESKAHNWPCGALCCSDLSTWGTKTAPHYDSEKKNLPVLLSIYHSTAIG